MRRPNLIIKAAILFLALSSTLVAQELKAIVPRGYESQ